MIKENTGTNLGKKMKSKGGGSCRRLCKTQGCLACMKPSWGGGGANHSRMTYNQLILSHWVQGFSNNILDEKDEGKHV